MARTPRKASEEGSGSLSTMSRPQGALRRYSPGPSLLQLSAAQREVCRTGSGIQDRDGAAHIVQVSHPPHTVDAGCQTEAGELSTSSPTNYSAPTLHKLADSGAPTWGANRASARIHDLPGIAWQHLFPPGDGQATTTPSEAGESSPGSGISATSPTRNAFAYRFLSVNNLNSMSSQDINFLESQGCFLVPARHVLDEFVEQYFLHSHPLLPFLNEGDFWDMYSEDSEETMPLLVFYSMLFSSCNFVSQSSIVALGFPSIRAARASLYRRAKLLYDLETELSPVHLSQAALLLTYWSPSDSSRLKRPNSTWLSMAIQNARAAQGPKYATMQTISKTANVKHHKRQASLKRLWWCCIIRDRILPLVVRRPLQITRSDFDFDKNLGLIYEDLQDYVERSIGRDFIYVVKLCTVLTDLITLVFPAEHVLDEELPLDSRELGRIRDSRAALEMWYESAARDFPVPAGTSTPVTNMPCLGRDFCHESTILYINVMYMYYYSAKAALSHYEARRFATAPTLSTFDVSLRESQVKYRLKQDIQDATSGTTACLDQLIQLQLAHYLPLSTMACTALPLFLGVLGAKFSSHQSTNGSLDSLAEQHHHLTILFRAMEIYKLQYDSVDFVRDMVKSIVAEAQSNILPETAPGSQPTTLSGWTDVLENHPNVYLRLITALDVFLKKSESPEEEDFPGHLRRLSLTSSHPSAAQDGIIDLEFASAVSDQSLGAMVHNAASCSHSSLDKNPFNDLWLELERYWGLIPGSLSAECDLDSAGHDAKTNDMKIEASQPSQPKGAELPPESLGVYTLTDILTPEVRADTDLILPGFEALYGWAGTPFNTNTHAPERYLADIEMLELLLQ
ncbi:fungal-specific transcription factor [Ilyonectria destructans]|nr:fungal-specific transcription factor [Ilyonectria destructans]